MFLISAQLYRRSTQLAASSPLSTKTARLCLALGSLELTPEIEALMRESFSSIVTEDTRADQLAALAEACEDHRKPLGFDLPVPGAFITAVAGVLDGEATQQDAEAVSASYLRLALGFFARSQISTKEMEGKVEREFAFLLGEGATHAMEVDLEAAFGRLELPEAPTEDSPTSTSKDGLDMNDLFSYDSE
jgi:hypothetical protein